MDKMTNSKALNYIKTHYDLPKEIEDKVNAMIAALDKKNSNRKPTAKQIANEQVRHALIAYINANVGEGDGFTVSELIKRCEVVNGQNSQYVSAILRQGILAHEVSKHTVKRQTRFVPYDPKYDTDAKVEE